LHEVRRFFLLYLLAAFSADSIIVYATAAGAIAADDEGRNGLFTKELLKNLQTPGLEVNELFRRTGGDVARASGGSQIPAIYSQFFGVVYLDSRPSSAPVITVQSTVRNTPEMGGIAFYAALLLGSLGFITAVAALIIVRKRNPSTEPAVQAPQKPVSLPEAPPITAYITAGAEAQAPPMFGPTPPLRGKNYDKYTFMGEHGLGKGRLVLAVIRQYIKDYHHSIALEDLQKEFPKEEFNVNQFTYGADIEVIDTYSNVVKSGNEQWYFMKDVITLNDGREIVVCREWGSHNINKFINKAERLGFSIEKEYTEDTTIIVPIEAKNTPQKSVKEKFRKWMIQYEEKTDITADAYKYWVDRISKHYSRQTGKNIDLYTTTDILFIKGLEKDYGIGGKYYEFGGKGKASARSAIAAYARFMDYQNQRNHNGD
jgi:hypothetical protein